MSKFKVGDRVVAIPGAPGSMYFKLKPFYVVKHVCADEGIELTDDDGDRSLCDERQFEHAPPEPPTINDLLPLIEQWGRDRGILDNSTPLGQSRKTVEEVRELVEEASALNVLSGLPGEDTTEVLDRLADAIGDIFVTLVMVAGCAKLDINACVAQAYETIKDRKGYLRPDGVFVKEEQV